MVRPIKNTEFSLLDEFLYQAIFLPPGTPEISRDVIYKPEIFIYINGFGSKNGDFGVVAEADGKIAGAAWTRIISAYGHIDDVTPELAISVLPQMRGRGIGTEMLSGLLALLRENGCGQTSLSVQKANPAVRLYLRAGYKIVKEQDEDFLMIKDLTR